MTKDQTEEKVNKIVDKGRKATLTFFRKKENQGNEKVKKALYKAILKGTVYRADWYVKEYEKYQGLNYSELLYEVFKEAQFKNEIFLRIAEERSGKEIASPEQFKEVTGIEGEDEVEWLADVYDTAITFRILNLMRAILQEEGTYQDLILIEPYYFNYRKREGVTWERVQHEFIITAINIDFYLAEAFSFAPGLRKVAKGLKAPYSVIMDAYNLTRLEKYNG